MAAHATRWLILLALLAPASALASERILLLVENRSENPAAIKEIAPFLSASLARKGYEVVSGPEVEAAGVQHPEGLTPQAAATLGQKFKAQTLLAVTVRFFLDPQVRNRGPEAGKAVGLTGKAFGAERVTWRNARGIVDEAVPKNRPVAAVAVSRLLWSLPKAPGAPVASNDEWDEMTGAQRLARGPEVPDYDVLIERMRAARTGPKFPLHIQKAAR
ncbi:MAG TPA: hypothetical protein VLW85_04340 [Myxococcales bacterium]|nr:hypothetical protein [Myxococcales bacterium]